MTARDAGGIACRAFALYLAILFVRGLALLPSQIQLTKLGSDMTRFSENPLPAMIMMVALYGMAAAILWVKADKFWPVDTVIQSTSMDASSWLRLSCILLGLYFLVDYGVRALYVFVKSFLATSAAWTQPSPGAIFEDVTVTIVAICLILYGSIGWKSQPAMNANDI